MKKIILFFTCFILIILLILGFSTSCIISGKYNLTAHQLTNDKLIYIDPGHGGIDGGTTYNGLLEKDVVLDISVLLKEALELFGYDVLLTRTKDESLGQSKKKDIYKRVDLINDSNAIMYLSIHANSYPSAKVKGAQTFYSLVNPKNQLIAKTMMDKLRWLDLTNQRIEKEISNKYLLDHVQIPGCLIEVGFLSNEEDYNNLINKEYQRNIAWIIAVGIDEFISKSIE